MTAQRPEAFRLMLRSYAKALVQLPLHVSVDGAGNFSPEQELLSRLNVYTSYRETQLGVQKHFFELLSLALETDSEWFLFLEDDLWLAPHLQRDLDALLELASANPEVVQWSLYSPEFHPVTGFPLQIPANAGNGYLAGVPASSGWIISREQALRFRNWHLDTPVPVFPSWMRHWQDSWKKYMGAYLMEKGQYNWFPHWGWSSNTGVAGRHMEEEPVHRSNTSDPGPLWLSCNWKGPRYDHWLEPEAAWLAELSGMPEIDAVDWFGIKPEEELKGQCIIGTRKPAAPLRSWGMLLRPDVLNIAENIGGGGIYVGKRENWLQAPVDALFWPRYYGVLPNWKRIGLAACKHALQSVILRRFRNTR